MRRLLYFRFIISYLIIFSFTLLVARPAYSIPKKLEELCEKYDMSFCAGPPKEEIAEEDQEEKPRDFSRSEKEILTRLLEHQKRLQTREEELERREAQLKALQEDIQRQIAQLEKLQRDIEKDIEDKKVQDSEQLAKAVAFYDKMDGAKASQSIAKLDNKIAVQILMKLKDKKASEILGNMTPEKSAQLIGGIARK